MADEKYFYSEHRPPLESGNYEIELTQTIQISKKDVHTDSIPFSFQIAGEQYSLNPGLIASVFPPRSGMGEYADVLPHLILKRSTLPWERCGNGIKDGIPWLALLLYSESEAKNYPVTQIPLHDLDPKNPGTDLISVISVANPSLFAGKLPLAEDISCLTHVRKHLEKETAVIVCNRLPAKGERNTVHLVSVENCYPPGAFGQKLVSLYNWSFFCTEHFKFTGDVIDQLQKNNLLDKQVLQLLNANYRNQEFFSWKEFNSKLNPADSPLLNQNKKALLTHFDLGHLASILNHLDSNVLKYVDSNMLKDPVTGVAAEAGYSSLPYTTVHGNKLDVLYRGPLIPFTRGTTVTKPFKPARHADQHFRTISLANQEIPEISHAAAWELGRLLCLQNKNLSHALFIWKRKHYQFLKDKTRSKAYEHLPPGADPGIQELPLIAKNYMQDLMMLKGIPFNYLIASEEMLPPESIRFFCLDVEWLKYLIDGVFSVGRHSASDTETDAHLWQDLLEGLFQKICSGFLLRSVAVAGWPDLSIEADLPIKRKEILSSDILLCVFDGVATKIAMYEKPEAMHFVADVGNPKKWISYRDLTDRTISISSPKPKSAELAAALISRPQKVTFES